jgi:hypothetical protein
MKLPPKPCLWCGHPLAYRDRAGRLHTPWCKRFANEGIGALVFWVWRVGMTPAAAVAYEAFCRTWSEACRAAQRAAMAVARSYEGPDRGRRSSRDGRLLVTGSTWAEEGAWQASYHFASMADRPPDFPPAGSAVLEPENEPAP